MGAATALLVTWVAFVAALAIWRPAGVDLRDAKRLAPDIVRLLHRLARDDEVPRTVRRRLALLLGYLALPFDVIPDFIPVLGYADDMIMIAAVLRSAVRAAGSELVEARWEGTPAGLGVVWSLAGLRAEKR